VLAILSFVFAFIFSPAAVVMGHISLSQIKKTREGGHGLALAAVIIGYVGVAFVGLYIVLMVVIFAIAVGTGGSSGFDDDSFSALVSIHA
jgi:Domain of unknown function (DUF4190)